MRKEGEGGCDFGLRSLLGGTVKDDTGGSGSDVNGAGFGEGIFRNDSREGRQDTVGAAGFGGIGVTRLGVSNVMCIPHCKSLLGSDVQNVQLVDRDSVEAFRLLYVCRRLLCV